MKFNYSKEIHNKNIEFAIEKDKEEELNIKLNELKKILKNLKKKKKRIKKILLNLMLKLKN